MQGTMGCLKMRVEAGRPKGEARLLEEEKKRRRLSRGLISLQP